MNPRIQAAITAGLTLAIAAILPPPWRLPFLAALLILTAGIYVGGALAIDRDLRWQLLQTAIIGGLVAATWLVHPLALAVGWLLHPGWDLLHRKHLHTGLPAWVIPWCLVYDLVVGVAIIAGLSLGLMPI